MDQSYLRSNSWLFGYARNIGTRVSERVAGHRPQSSDLADRNRTCVPSGNIRPE